MAFFKKAVFAARRAAPAALCFALLVAGSVDAREEAAGPGSGSGHEVLAFPDNHLYAPYLADPGAIGFGLQVLQYAKTGIPAAGSTRFDLKSGGSFGLVRFHPRGNRDLGWEIGLEAGFHAQFDIRNELDNLGWDGRYGLTVSAARTRNLSFKAAYLHDSSHVGDEYAEKTGRLRIGYTREELAAGVSFAMDSGWRTYAEYGHGMLLSNKDLQKPGRIQFGLERQPRAAEEGSGWYGAMDLSAMEERDWKLDVSLQAGYRIDAIDKTWRFGFTCRRGRPPIGEFFQHTETYAGFGVWVDI